MPPVTTSSKPFNYFEKIALSKLHSWMIHQPRELPISQTYVRRNQPAIVINKQFMQMKQIIKDHNSKHSRPNSSRKSFGEFLSYYGTVEGTISTKRKLHYTYYLSMIKRMASLSRIGCRSERAPTRSPLSQSHRTASPFRSASNPSNSFRLSLLNNPDISSLLPPNSFNPAPPPLFHGSPTNSPLPDSSKPPPFRRPSLWFSSRYSRAMV